MKKINKAEKASKEIHNLTNEAINLSMQMFFADYGYLDEILVGYKLGRITIDEAKLAIKYAIKNK